MPGLSGAGFNGDVARNNIDIVECVKCGHQMREADKEARDHVRKDEQVIGIFIRTSDMRRVF